MLGLLQHPLDGKTALQELFVHDCSVARRYIRWSERATVEQDGLIGVLPTRSLDVIKEHVADGDLRAASGIPQFLPREALHRAPTPPPTAEQREDVGVMLRARLAELEALLASPTPELIYLESLLRICHSQPGSASRSAIRSSGNWPFLKEPRFLFAQVPILKSTPSTSSTCV